MLLCSGGCRSGKSEFARLWVESLAPERIYIATAYIADDEMALRVERHRNARGQGWLTHEAAKRQWNEPEQWVPEVAAMGGAILFDCLTLWTSLCLERGLDEVGVLNLTDRLLTSFGGCGKPVALVTNEVGMGLVPATLTSRKFRDVAGLVNQRAGDMATTVVFMVCGQPLYVKGRGPLF